MKMKRRDNRWCGILAPDYYQTYREEQDMVESVRVERVPEDSATQMSSKFDNFCLGTELEHDRDFYTMAF